MALYDPYGREISSLPKSPDSEMLGAVRIRDQWSSYPSQGITPARLASILKEADAGDILRQCELAEEFEEKDPDLSSLLHTRKLAVQGLDWEILPASESAEDQKIAEFCRKQLEDLDSEELTLDLMDAIFKGFACLELQWDISEGQAWIKKLEWIPQHRFTFLTKNATLNEPIPKVPNLLTEAEPAYGIEVPPFKLIYHRYKARAGFAQRSGLFRPCAFYYVFKNFATKDWLIFLEKYAQPTRIGKYTASASRDGANSDVEILKTAVQNLGADAAAVISDTTMIELIEAKSSGASSDLYDRFIDGRINKAYAKAILGQTATSEGTPGALGNEKARSDVRRDILVADAKAVAKTRKEQMIWPIVGFNFGWDKTLPFFRYHTEEEEDLQYLSTVHKTLVDMGVPIPLSFIRKKYFIPEPANGEEVLGASHQQEIPPPADMPAPAVMNGLRLKKKVVPVGGRLVPLRQERA